ncbi:MAG: tRNA epoxyqueuosine(34) reductase QueG, partial [Acidimicrobiia bacterium]|nr:tRNA epoxyqueuosine(34) reductase QueG [Acidimicrobiia bacterium]
MTTLAEELRAIGQAAGLTAVGFARAERFEATREVLETRKTAGLAAGMQFTYRNPARSTDPSRILTGARTLVVGARRYATAAPRSPLDQPHGRVAAYARIDHYADLRAGLDTIANRLRADGATARVVADDNALVDREAAVRAGIGWYGKNTNVLLPGEGSWFVLGAVVTDAEIAPDRPVETDCGSCTRCLTACPTDAIIAPGVLDARRCLAWLVQAPGEIPRQYRVAMGDRIYGCDDCQDVCPPNRRTTIGAPTGDATGSGPWIPLLDLLEADDDEVMRRAGRWYVAERDPRHVRRNALVVIGNVGRADDPRVVAVLRGHIAGPDDLVAAHAAWAARRLGLDHLCDIEDPGPLLRAELA